MFSGSRSENRHKTLNHLNHHYPEIITVFGLLFLYSFSHSTKPVRNVYINTSICLSPAVGDDKHSLV